MMKRYIQLMPKNSFLACFLLTIVLLVASCQKETVLEPSDQDENYFIIKDNPNDPVDHAIYQFYESTGVASFYNDTIHRRRIADSAGIPRYTYLKLSLSYSPFGNASYYHKAVTSKSPIPSLLGLLKEKLLPKLPDNLHLHSIFLVDSIGDVTQLINKQISDGWTSLNGFNTVAIQVKDVGTMNNEEQKMYIASILAGLADKRINNARAIELQNDFYSISRSQGKALSPFDIYIGLPFIMFTDPTKAPDPKKVGFMKYTDVATLGIMLPLYLMSPPREVDDLRMYLTAAFYYSTPEFYAKYTNEPPVLKKFDIIKSLARQVGFQLPD